MLRRDATVGTALLLTLLLGSACSSSGGGTNAARSTAGTAPETSAARGGTSIAVAPCAKVTDPTGGNGAKEVNDPGDIPDDQAFVAYSAPSAALTLRVPEGWARSESGGTVTFTDKFNSVTIEVLPAPSAPTVASVRTEEVRGIAAKERCFELGDVTSTHRKGGDAVLVTYRVDGQPDAVTGKVVREAVERYEFWRNGREAVLTLSGAMGADNVDPWKIVSDSFVWT